MTKDQFENLLRSTGCDENSIRFGVNAFEMGVEHEREECAKICFELRFTTEGPGETAAYQRTLCGTAIKENFGLQGKGPITAKNVK